MKNDFENNGYFIVKNFLDIDFVNFIQHYFFVRIKAGQYAKEDSQAPLSRSFYGDPLMDSILDLSCDALSEISGFKLLPTYTYTRMYSMGDELHIHRDRPSCEISATLALAVPEGSNISPIYFSQNEDKSDATEIILEPGDLCLYRGCDLYHWREPFTQKWYLQSFLHYINADGPYQDNIYDGREFLGTQKDANNSTF
jgi:hypothetical protein